MYRMLTQVTHRLSMTRDGRLYASGQPEPAEVADWTLRALTAIGRRTGSGRAKAAFRTRWHMKNWIVRRVVRRDSFRQWPWPAQQYVKYQLI